MGCQAPDPDLAHPQPWQALEGEGVSKPEGNMSSGLGVSSSQIFKERLENVNNPISKSFGAPNCSPPLAIDAVATPSEFLTWLSRLGEG